MLVFNFNLSSRQIQVLMTFRQQPDTRKVEQHGFGAVAGSACVVVMRKLCDEGYLEWHNGDREAKPPYPPGYTLTAKGEMILRVIESELRRSLEWFDGKPEAPAYISGGANDVAAGKSKFNKAGIAKKKAV